MFLSLIFHNSFSHWNRSNHHIGQIRIGVILTANVCLEALPLTTKIGIFVGIGKGLQHDICCQNRRRSNLSDVMTTSMSQFEKSYEYQRNETWNLRRVTFVSRR